MSSRAKFKLALAVINLVVAWVAMALLPKESASYTFRSPAEQKFKAFVLTFDWSMIFMIVGMSILVTVSLWLILSSYDKLPSEAVMTRSPDERDST